jgi:hypothetical protein
VHWYGVVGLDDIQALSVRLATLAARVYLIVNRAAVTNELETEMRVPAQGAQGGWNSDAGTVVPAHGIYCQMDFVVQLSAIYSSLLCSTTLRPR